MFVLVVSAGERIDGETLVSFEGLESATGRRAGIDAIGLRVSVTKGEHQTLFDVLYKRLLDQSGAGFPRVFEG